MPSRSSYRYSHPVSGERWSAQRGGSFSSVLWGRVVFALLLMGSMPAWGVAETGSTGKPTSSVETLIRRLRSPQFQERMRAEADCRKTGSDILPALTDALDSPNAELRRRAQRLIEQIEEDELSGAIESFLSQHPRSTLPGWSMMSDLVDDTPENRAAYADILRGNARLSRALSHPHLIGTELQNQLQKVGTHLGSIPNGVTPSRASGILLLLVHPDANYSSDWGETALRTIRNGIIQGVNETPPGQTLQALTARAVTIPKAGLAQDRMDLALRLSLPEVVTPALELITQRNNPHQLNFAFVAIARYGGAAEMAVVETLLQDTFELSAGGGPNNQKTSSTQVRDLALAALIEMTSQDPKEYGLRDFPRDHSHNLTNLVVSFENDTLRAAAFQKWEDWSQAHLRKYRPLPAMAEEGTTL